MDRNAQLIDMQQQLVQIAPLSFQMTRPTETGAERRPSSLRMIVLTGS